MQTERPFIYLAPIRGITDALFRDILFSHFKGFDAAVAPFINPQKKSLFEEKTLFDVLPENNLKVPIIPQLLHTDPQAFLTLAKRLTDLGYTHLNWNIGCPAPMVAKKKKGSGLLPYPDEILAFLDEVIPQLEGALSIKTRLGYYSNTEIVHLLPHLNQYPLKEIIIHTRLGRQLYRGETDPDCFRRCLDLSDHRLVYNGDIVDNASFRLLTSLFPENSSWMIGRGILANPLLAEEMAGFTAPDHTERYHRLYNFHNELYQRYQQKLSGPGHLLGRLKLIWSYLFKSFDLPAKFLKKIQKSKTVPQYLQAVTELFEKAR